MNWFRVAAILIVCSMFTIHLGQAQDKDKKEFKDKKDDKKKDDKKKDDKKKDDTKKDDKEGDKKKDDKKDDKKSDKKKDDKQDFKKDDKKKDDKKSDKKKDDKKDFKKDDKKDFKKDDKTTEAKKERKYPVVNLANGFEFDANWPLRPTDMQWGHVPGIAVDSKDNVYVFTRAKHSIQVFDNAGKFVRSWGKDIDKPHHVKVDADDNIWIADIGHHVIQKYTPDGKVLLTIGTKGVAGRDKAKFYMPTDMAIAANGDIFVSDGYGNARIVHFDKYGKYLNEWGDLGHGPGQFSIPHAIAIDSKGKIFVADRNNVRVQVFDTKGRFLEEWRDLIVPWGFHMTKSDELWVCGSSPMQWRKEDTGLGVPPKDQIFMKFNSAGRLLQLFTIPKGIDGLERPGEVNWVHCIALDSGGNMYVGDIIGRRAQKFALRTPQK